MVAAVALIPGGGRRFIRGAVMVALCSGRKVRGGGRVMRTGARASPHVAPESDKLGPRKGQKEQESSWTAHG